MEGTCTRGIFHFDSKGKLMQKNSILDSYSSEVRSSMTTHFLSERYRNEEVVQKQNIKNEEKFYLKKNCKLSVCRIAYETL